MAAGSRPTPLAEDGPQEKPDAGIGYELDLALDVPVLQTFEQKAVEEVQASVQALHVVHALGPSVQEHVIVHEIVAVQVVAPSARAVAQEQVIVRVIPRVHSSSSHVQDQVVVHAIPDVFPVCHVQELVSAQRNF